MMRLRWTVFALSLGVAVAVLMADRSDAAELWPVPGGIVRDFDPPDPDWLPGHRGIDLAAAPGGRLVTPRAGVVQFTGSVAGTPVVTVAHGALRATYQPAVGTADIGSSVPAGGTLGSVAAGGHCSDRCLHWGAILNGRYVDPRLLLGHTHVELRPL